MFRDQGLQSEKERALAKLVLIVAHYEQIKLSRTKVVKNAGYDVLSASSDDEAILMLDCEVVDLVMIGRRSASAAQGLDQRIREKCPVLPILKIEGEGLSDSRFVSRTVPAEPVRMIAALQELLG